MSSESPDAEEDDDDDDASGEYVDGAQEDGLMVQGPYA
jgi:hypothetical protein